MLTRYASYIEQTCCVIKHNSGASNRVANSLFRRTTLLVTMSNEVVGIKCLKKLNEANKSGASNQVTNGNWWC